MRTKTFLFTLALAGVFAGPVLAASTSDEDTSGTSSVEAALEASDEAFIQQLANDPSTLVYKAGLPGGDAEEEDKPKVKYVYKGQPIGELRRAITDDRIDDGYVQGLLQQRGLK